MERCRERCPSPPTLSALGHDRGHMTPNNASSQRKPVAVPCRRRQADHDFIRSRDHRSRHIGGHAHARPRASPRPPRYSRGCRASQPAGRAPSRPAQIALQRFCAERLEQLGLEVDQTVAEHGIADRNRDPLTTSHREAAAYARCPWAPFARPRRRMSPKTRRSHPRRGLERPR
jgi:hypothetical protein